MTPCYEHSKESLQRNKKDKKVEKTLEHVRAMLEYKEKMRAHCHCAVWLCLLVKSYNKRVLITQNIK